MQSEIGKLACHFCDKPKIRVGTATAFVDYPTAIRRITKRTAGDKPNWVTLECGHEVMLPFAMLSAQEFYITPDGERIQGGSLPLCGVGEFRRGKI